MTQSISVSFGALLRRHRLAAQLTQEELAWKAELHPNAISLLECDARRPRRTTIAMLADALDLEDADRSALQAAGSQRTSSPTPSNGSILIPRTCGNFLGALPKFSLVGRAIELTRIQADCAHVAQGVGCVHILAGEPGIGKTRLLQEVTECMRQQGWLVATGRCFALSQTTAFAPWCDALTEVYTTAPSALRDQALAQWPDLRRLVFDQQTNPAVTGTPLDPRVIDEQSRLFWVVAQYLLALSEHAPLVIALDDLHWADAPSLALLQSVVHQTRQGRVLVLGAYRDNELPRQHPLAIVLRDLRREHLAAVTTLSGLSAEETRKFIATAAPALEVEPEVIEFLHQRAGGNPLFIWEMVRASVDLVTRQEREDALFIMPESVLEVVSERVARLSAATQTALRQASVLGQVFDFDDLLGMDVGVEAQLEGTLREACDTQLIHEAGPNSYCFSHAVFQEAIYADLTAAQRRRWHRLAGEAIARSSDQARRTAELAAHFRRGGAPERALPYLIAAGEYACDTYAYSVAEDHLHEAVALARDLGDQASTALALSHLGYTYYLQHDFDAALASLAESLRLARAIGEQRTLLYAARILGYVYGSINGWNEGIALLNQVLDIPDVATTHPNPVAKVLLALSQLLNLADRDAEALAVADRAVAIARILRDRELEALAEVRRGCALVGLNRIAEWHQVNEVILPLFAEAGDLHSYCHAVHMLCTKFCVNMAFEDQRRFLTYALNETERLGDPLLSSELANDLGVAHFVTGNWREARKHYESALALTKKIITPQTTAQVHWFLAILDVAEGYQARGVKGLRCALALAERFHLGAMLSLHWDFAEIELLAGQPDQAYSRLQPLVGSGDDRATSFLLPLLAWAALDLDEIAEAKALLAHSAALSPEWRQFFSQIELTRVQAMFAVRTGIGTTAAATNLTHALARTRTINYPHEEVRLLYAQGLLHDRIGDAACARQSFQEALVLCKRLGERWYAPHITRALKRLARSK